MAADLDFENYGHRVSRKARKNNEENEEQTIEILRWIGVKPPHGHRAAVAFTMYSTFKHSSSRVPGAPSQTVAAANIIVASIRRHGRSHWHEVPPAHASH